MAKTSSIAASRVNRRQIWLGYGATALAKSRTKGSGATRARRQRHTMLATSGRAKLGRRSFVSRLHPRDAAGRFRRK